MDTNPGGNGHDDDTHRKPEPSASNQPVSKAADTEQRGDPENDRTSKKTPVSIKFGLARAWLWCRRNFWDSWSFDPHPSIFEALTLVLSGVGLVFLVMQWGQTQSALREASESNRLTRLAQEKADDDSATSDQRQERLIAANEITAAAARDSASAAKDSAAAFISGSQALNEGNMLTARLLQQNALSFKNDQRARVFVSPRLVGAEPKTASDMLGWEIGVTNSGKTEALKMRSLSYAYGASEPEAPPAWNSIAAVEGTPLSTGQTDRTFRTQPFKFSEQGLSLYLKKSVKLYLWNRVYYCDSFQRLHWVQTCAFHTYGTELTRRAGYCEAGNMTDSNDGDATSPECKLD